jgi:nucleoside-diphosphate-sugar epimerase
MQTEKARETEMVLVLGGTSKTGRRVAERLEAREAAATCVWGDGR